MITISFGKTAFRKQHFPSVPFLSSGLIQFVAERFTYLRHFAYDFMFKAIYFMLKRKFERGGRNFKARCTVVLAEEYIFPA